MLPDGFMGFEAIIHHRSLKTYLTSTTSAIAPSIVLSFIKKFLRKVLIP